MNKGKIVFLNGLTSAGKTSIIDFMKDMKEFMFFSLGFDLFEDTIPYWAIDDDGNYSKAIKAMYECAKSFSDQNEIVFIDGLIFNIDGLENHYEMIKKIFADYPLSIVNVYCPLEVLRLRNIERKDRRENQSYKQSLIAEKNVDYALVVDTSELSVKECAQIIIDKLNLRKTV